MPLVFAVVGIVFFAALAVIVEVAVGDVTASPLISNTDIFIAEKNLL